MSGHQDSGRAPWRKWQGSLGLSRAETARSWGVAGQESRLKERKPVCAERTATGPGQDGQDGMRGLTSIAVSEGAGAPRTPVAAAWRRSEGLHSEEARGASRLAVPA